MNTSIFKRSNASIVTAHNFYNLVKSSLVDNYCPTYFDSLNVNVSFVVQQLTYTPKVPTIYVKKEGNVTHITTETSKESFDILHKMMTVSRFMDDSNGLQKLHDLLKPNVAADLKEFFDNASQEEIFEGLINFDILPIVVIEVK